MLASRGRRGGRRLWQACRRSLHRRVWRSRGRRLLRRRAAVFACYCDARRAARQRVSRPRGGGVTLGKLARRLARSLGAGRQPAGEVFTTLISLLIRDRRRAPNVECIGARETPGRRGPHGTPPDRERRARRRLSLARRGGVDQAIHLVRRPFLGVARRRRGSVFLVLGGIDQVLPQAVF